MQTVAHRTHKKHVLSPRKLAKRVLAHKINLRAKGTALLKPVKKMNKQVVKYVTKKPYQTLGIATLLSSALIAGIAFAKFKHFIK